MLGYLVPLGTSLWLLAGDQNGFATLVDKILLNISLAGWPPASCVLKSEVLMKTTAAFYEPSRIGIASGRVLPVETQ